MEPSRTDFRPGLMSINQWAPCGRPGDVSVMPESLDELHREILMEHYRFPRGKDPIDNPDLAGEGKNISCGDEVDVQVRLDGETVKNIGVHCAGCAIAIASGSMMAELVEGKSLIEVKKIAAAVRAVLTGEEPDEKIDVGDLRALEGIRKYPVRVRCALLAWTALIEAIETHDRGAHDRTRAPEGK